MQQKTRDRLDDRFLALPLHHIDTSILLEPDNTPDGIAAKRYQERLGKLYRGVLSLPVLGELMLTILSLGDLEKRLDFLELLNSRVKVRRMNYYTSLGIESLSKEISALDARVHGADKEILACAIEHKAHALVTLDGKLIRNEALERKFGIRIRHPKDFL
jgi:predicted nucleic acid-binding protein